MRCPTNAESRELAEVLIDRLVIELRRVREEPDGSFVTSAETCLEDAVMSYAREEYIAAAGRARRGLQYVVGFAADAVRRTASEEIAAELGTPDLAPALERVEEIAFVDRALRVMLEDS